MRVILASASETRKKALDSIGVKYDVVPSNVDEKTIRHHDAKTLALALAEAKAREVGSREDGIIVAGDLFVVFRGKIYEKPKNKSEAMEMLTSFSGGSLEMIVGMAVYNSITKVMLSSVDVAEIRFRKLSDEEIREYVMRYPVTQYAAGFGPDGAKTFSASEPDKMFLSAFNLEKLKSFLEEIGMD